MIHLQVLKHAGSSQSHRLCLHLQRDSALLITKGIWLKLAMHSAKLKTKK